MKLYGKNWKTAHRARYDVIGSKRTLDDRDWGKRLLGVTERVCSRVPMEHSYFCGQPAGSMKPGLAFGEIRKAWIMVAAGSRFYGVLVVGAFPSDDAPARNLSIHSRSSGLM